MALLEAKTTKIPGVTVLKNVAFFTTLRAKRATFNFKLKTNVYYSLCFFISLLRRKVSFDFFLSVFIL